MTALEVRKLWFAVGILCGAVIAKGPDLWAWLRLFNSDLTNHG